MELFLNILLNWPCMKRSHVHNCLHWVIGSHVHNCFHCISTYMVLFSKIERIRDLDKMSGKPGL